MKKLFILITCEHASNSIPAKFKHLFLGKKNILMSHRGYDQGSKYLGKVLSIGLNAPVIYGNFSRQLIDLNRSAHHRNAFSEITKFLSIAEKQYVICKYHQLHWEKINSIIEEKISAGHVVLHLGVHSFTPVLNNKVRTADVGILYDPRRKKERNFAQVCVKRLRENSQLRFRRNYPYLGKLDGLTTVLRKKYSEKSYIGLEIEVNHAVIMNHLQLKTMGQLLIKSFKESTQLYFK
jgi:predicted N-formylglutamate amidohydrolase